MILPYELWSTQKFEVKHFAMDFSCKTVGNLICVLLDSTLANIE